MSWAGDKRIDFILENHRDVNAVLELCDDVREKVPGRIESLVRGAIRDAPMLKELQLRVDDGVKEESGEYPSWGDKNMDPAWDPSFIWGTEIDFDKILQEDPAALGTLTVEVPYYYEKDRRAREWIAFIKSNTKLFSDLPDVRVLPDGDLLEGAVNDKDPHWFTLLDRPIDKAFVSECLQDRETLQQKVADLVNSFTRQVLPLLREGPRGR